MIGDRVFRVVDLVDANRRPSEIMRVPVLRPAVLNLPMEGVVPIPVEELVAKLVWCESFLGQAIYIVHDPEGLLNRKED
jgi:hypothetical protein